MNKPEYGTSIPRNKENLPQSAQCGEFNLMGELLCTEGHVFLACRDHKPSGCQLFNTDDPEVRRILKERGKDLAWIHHWARCTCGEKKKQAVKAARDRRMTANLPNDDDPKDFASFVVVDGNRDAYDATTLFTRGGATTMLLLEGEHGSGKSHLLEATGRRYLEASRSVHYDTAASMVNQIRSVYGSDAMDSVQMVIDWIKGFDVLLLDELCGDENITDNAKGWLFEIIDERYRNHRRIVMATNKKIDEVADKLGDRIASRLWSRSEPHVRHVLLTATDYRMEE